MRRRSKRGDESCEGSLRRDDGEVPAIKATERRNKARSPKPASLAIDRPQASRTSSYKCTPPVQTNEKVEQHGPSLLH